MILLDGFKSEPILQATGWLSKEESGRTMRMILNDIKTFVPRKLLVKPLLISGVGSLVGSLIFAVVDSYFYLNEIYYIILKFLIGIMLSIFPATFGGYLLVIISQTLKQNCRRNVIMHVMVVAGGVLGIILGFLICISVDAMTNHRMPYELFYFRLITVEVISLITGGFNGGFIASFAHRC